MIDLKRGINPGLAAMWGSDESRGRERNIAFGLTKRKSMPNTFITITPDTASTLCIAINCREMNGEQRHLFTINGIINYENIPNRNERKKFSGANPYLSAEYAKRILDCFINNFFWMGYNLM